MKSLLFVLLVIMLVVCSIVSQAQIPRTISYQGVLSDTAGYPKKDSTYSITFRLYQAASGGSAIWTETKSLQTRRGLFSTQLGDVTPFSPNGLITKKPEGDSPFAVGLVFDKQYWMSIQVGTDAELSPRTPLSSVPYSINSIKADTAKYSLAGAGASQWTTTGSDIYYNSAGRVGIGTTPSQTLDVNGNIAIPATTATTGIIYQGSKPLIHSFGSGNFFAGQGAGNLTLTGWANTATGDSALYSNTSGCGNTATGHFSLLYNTTGSVSTAIGCYALSHNTSGYANTACGYNALTVNSTGWDNTAIGEGALHYNSAGWGNTAIGEEVLSSNQTGNGNTACGYTALYYDVDGGGNTANGAWALENNTHGSNNTANGSATLVSNTTGWGNTAGGLEALYTNTTGTLNTASGCYSLFLNNSGYRNSAFGDSALYSNTTGSNNTAIGYFADVSANNLTNATAIGCNARVGQSNSLVLGGTGSYAVSVGIGTTTPSSTLDVVGTAKMTGFNLSSGAGAGKVLTSDASGMGTWQTSSVGSNPPFGDASALMKNSTDATKLLSFNLSGIATGTTRALTVPDANTTLVGTDVAQTLTNKTLTAPVISTINNTGTLTLPTSTDQLVGRATTDVLANKTITGATNTVAASQLRTAGSDVVVSTATAPTTGQVLTATSATAATWQTPSVGSNPPFSDASPLMKNSADATKLLSFNLSGITTGTTRTVTVPNANTTLVGTDVAQTLTNKTLTAPVISTISNTGTLTLPTSTDQLLGRATTDVLTNKTITGITNTVSASQLRTTGSDVVVSTAAAPTTGQVLTATSGTAATWQTPSVGSAPPFSDASPLMKNSADATKLLSFNLSGITTGTTRTVTVPNANTTLVGTDVAQTLTNKTLTAPVISTISNTGTLTLPTSTDQLLGRATTDVLTNKTITGITNTVAASQLRTAGSDVVVSTAAAPTTGQVLTATSGTAATWQTPSVGSAPPFSDASALVKNSTDATKLAVFNLSGITTGTTRTLTMPNANTTLVGTDVAQTLTNKTLTAPIISTITNTGTLTLPTSTDQLVGRATTDALTNKTIAGTTNTVAASQLRTAGSDVVVSSAPAPAAGQVLTATSATAAAWQTPASSQWTTSGSDIYYNAGKVGIGTATPGFPLSFGNGLGDKISLFGSATSHYGIGIQNYLLQLHTEDASGDIAFGYGSSASFTEVMRVKGTGNVGIGTTTPSANAKLDVENGSVLFSGTTGSTPVSGAGTRLMWIPSKSAFRAGGAYLWAWDDANVGNYSIGTGYWTTASGAYSTAMGTSTIASGEGSTAIGTDYTQATGHSSVAMGSNSYATGDYSTAMASGRATGHGSIAIGYGGVASGVNSITIGEGVSTNGKFGSLIIGDGNNLGSSTVNTADYQFMSRFVGGYVLYSDMSGTTGVKMDAGTSGWGVVSDRNKKENFRSIDSEELLHKIRMLSITEWNYKNADPSIKYIGPVAQDFYAAFHLGGTDSLAINSICIDGVNMAAVQALEKRTAEQQQTIEDLRAELKAMNAKLERIQTALQRGNASESGVKVSSLDTK